jgi:predicted glutamine amidotransferase
MCGLYAIFDKTGKGLDSTDLTTLQQMGIITQLRGMHSSGLFVVDKESVNGKPIIVKTTGPSCNLEWEKTYENAKNVISTTAVAAVGHGRLATTGKINKQNAHPFNHDKITLVHNGTIRKGLEEEMKSTDVDSHALTKSISKLGVIDALHQIIGAYAIILHNEEDGNIYIVRNLERSLYYKETYDRIYVMSEMEALIYLNARLHLWWDKKEPEQFSAEKVYQFDTKSRTLTQENEIVRKVVYSFPEAPVRTSHKFSYEPKKENNRDKIAAYKRGETVEFVVQNTFPTGNNMFTFSGVDVYENTIWFVTDKPHPEWVGRSGLGCVTAVHYGTKIKGTLGWSYQLKAREVLWDEERETSLEESLVETLEEIINKDEWDKLVKETPCSSCDSALDSSTPEQTYVTKVAGKWKCVCPSCTGAALDCNYIDNPKDLHKYLANL